MQSNLFFYSCISLAIIFYFSSNSLGQEKINLSVGFGIVELANIGVRYQLEEAQIGLSVGTFPWNGEKNLSVLGDVHFHFGDYSELSSRKPWYFRIGLAYLYSETENIIYNFFYLNSRLGREFNISKKIGIYLDLGINYEIKNDHKRKTPEPDGPYGGGQGWHYPLIPAFSVGMYYRL